MWQINDQQVFFISSGMIKKVTEKVLKRVSKVSQNVSTMNPRALLAPQGGSSKLKMQRHKGYNQ